MKRSRRKRLLLASGLALAAAAAAHGWRHAQPREVRALATIAWQAPQSVSGLEGRGRRSAARVESEILSDEVLRAAAQLLAERNADATLGEEGAFDHDALLARSEVRALRRHNGWQVELTHRAARGDQAVAALTAIVEAWADWRRSSGETEADPESPEHPDAALEELNASIDAHRHALVDLEAGQLEAASGDAGAGALAERLKTIASALAAAQHARIEAENKLVQARQDLAAGVPAGLLAARLLDATTRAALEQESRRTELEEELRELRQQHRQQSAIFGRKHPRLMALSQRVQSLEASLESANSASGSADQPAESEPRRYLLMALEGSWKLARGIEQDLLEEWNAAEETRREVLATEQKRAALRAEVARLEADAARLRARAAGRGPSTEGEPEWVRPPAVETAAAPGFAGTAMEAAAAGIMAALVVLFWPRGGRSARPARPAESFEMPRPQAASPGDQEQRLARLRMLAGSGS